MMRKLIIVIVIGMAILSAGVPLAVAAVTISTDHVAYRTVDIDGIKVFYREAGLSSLPTLVLLHGNPSSSFMFRDLIPRLAANFHVFAPDYPGFGYSDTPPQLLQIPLRPSGRDNPRISEKGGRY
jgi:hypothetical protein